MSRLFKGSKNILPMAIANCAQEQVLKEDVVT